MQAVFESSQLARCSKAPFWSSVTCGSISVLSVWGWFCERLLHDWCLTLNKNICMFAPSILEYCSALIQPCRNIISVMLPRPLCGLFVYILANLAMGCGNFYTWLFRNPSVLSVNQFILFILVPHPFPILPFINFPFSFARPHYVSQTAHSLSCFRLH